MLTRIIRPVRMLARSVTSGPFREGARCLMLHPVGQHK